MTDSPQRAWSRRAWLGAAVGAVAQVAAAGSCFAQAPVHYFQDSRLPLGAVAQGQLARHARMRGYLQPIELQGPRGTMVSVAEGGAFGPPEPMPLKVGLQIGPVYRFKVVGIPLHEGEEVFPSVELINRLHPPEGQRVRFPVPIQFTREELELALQGNYVTRVVYLEDPANAFPMADEKGTQRYYDVGTQDPLKAADKLGRPMAIIRLGSRVPLLNGNGSFTFSAPSVERYPQPEEIKPPPQEGLSRNRGLEPGPRRHYPRQPLSPARPPGYPLLGQPPAVRIQR